MKKHLIFFSRYVNIAIVRGGVAQLGECLNGIQEVVGSIPIVSTRSKSLETRLLSGFQGFLLFLTKDNDFLKSVIGVILE